MTLTKQDFIQNVSKNLRMPQNDSAELVETLLELIKTTLASGE
ncbi:MAG: HU family DNA-binding protein, partial [Thermodesulfobacteriota bacterium]